MNDRRWHAAIAVVLVAAIIRLAFAALLPVFPDEAYYWDWSRRLAPGYFDHPPGIAWVVRLGVMIAALFGGGVGSSPLGMRVGVAVAALVASLATIGTARHIAGSRAALRAALVMAVLPLSAAGLVLSTPDVPVLAAEAVALYCVVRALDSDLRSRASLGWWTVAGVALGAAFASSTRRSFCLSAPSSPLLRDRRCALAFASPDPTWRASWRRWCSCRCSAGTPITSGFRFSIR
jgi:4-amino-4-deoxy-L-arabinose transferase-like glycosyltransferase